MTPALIVALNPSIDAEWRVPDVLWEEKNNVLGERRWAGGKGINVARWLKHLGGKPLLALPLGGRTGRELAGFLKREKLPTAILPLREPTRVNIIVTTAAGRQMRFNPLGPKLSAREWAAMVKVIQMQLQQGRARHSVRAANEVIGGQRSARPAIDEAASGLLVLSGSLPRGVPVSVYAQLIAIARGLGVKTLLDCDGPVLSAALKARPFLVKPNEHELAQWWGRAVGTEVQVKQAARSMSSQTRGWVLVSRGAKRALLVNAEMGVELFATPPRVRVRNTVGAGDALLAAVAWQILRGASPQEWLRQGVSTGSRATRNTAGKISR